MKKLLLIMFIGIVLASCQTNPSNNESVINENEKDGFTSQQTDDVTPPSSLNSDRGISTFGTSKEVDITDSLLDQINTTIKQPNITEDDIRRGWYYAPLLQDKKYGTPDTWQWIEDGEHPQWISPNMIGEIAHLKNKELCQQKRGVYILSCIESESLDCEYIPESECRCQKDARMHNEQGCILVDEEGQFVEIGISEFSQGWYNELQGQKKLNTPKNWIWQKERWQNPDLKNH